MFELASFPSDLLRFDAAEVERLAGADPRLGGVRATLVEPGEPVRITHVLDAVEPRVRPDGRAAFPGLTGPDAACGTGRTHALAGVLVVPVLDFPGEERPLHEQESIVDMAGPGASLTRCGDARAVVLEFEPANGVPHRALDEAARVATLRVAEHLAMPTLAAGAAAAELEQFDIPPVERALPRIALLLQLAALGQLFDVHYHGRVVDSVGLPRVIDPFEVLDGALTCGEYHWAALRNPTVTYQRNALITELTRRHGTDLAFAGVVAVRGYEQTADDKWAAAQRAAAAAKNLGAQAAIVTTDAGGNSHTDSMLTVRACAQAGLLPVVVVAEMADPQATNPGLTDWVPEAASIVSVGNAEELVPEWTPSRVLGGDVLLDGTPAGAAGAIPVRNYLGATCQMGDLALTASTW